LQRFVLNPIRDQLTRGITPDKLAWTISLGLMLGVFPIMGTTSLLCFVVGYGFKLNQPILHLFKTLSYPLHIALILVFIRCGQLLNGSPPIPLSIPQLLTRFKESPLQFASDFGLAALHGIEAWLISAIILVPLIHFITLPLLKKIIRKDHSKLDHLSGK
jgi:uncharacterized protein (DUF2062 family)